MQNVWQAYLVCHGTRYFGGNHETFEDAVNARRQLELTHFGMTLDPD